MPLWLTLALSAPAQAFVLDLAADPMPIGRVEGRAAVQIELPTAVLASRDSLRILGSTRGGSLRSLAGWDCVVTMADGNGLLAESLEDCGQLYNLPPGGHADFVRQIPPAEATILRLAVAPADTAGTIIISSDNRLFLGGELSEVDAATAWIGARWYAVDVDIETRALTLTGDARTALGTWLQTGTQDLVVRAELHGASREAEWRAARVWVPEVERQAQAVAAAEAAREWCLPEARPAAMQRTFLVCVEAETGQVRTRRYDEHGDPLEQDRHALPTGAYIEVAVHHPVDATVAITLDDDRGSSRGEELVAPLPDAGAVKRSVTRRLFAPRSAGPVEVRAEAGGAPIATEEFEVVDRYLGALRVGMAITTPSRKEWTLGPQNATGTAQIIASGSDIVDGELIASIAPFLERGGRDYLLPRDFRVAPQIGLGVIAVNGASVRFSLFQSFYVGAEVELTPSFVVSLSGTLRRVSRLARGYDELDLLDAGAEIPTTGSFRPGLGLAVAFTPQALRLRAPVR